jgi:hypothetical protein
MFRTYCREIARPRKGQAKTLFSASGNDPLTQVPALFGSKISKDSMLAPFTHLNALYISAFFWERKKTIEALKEQNLPPHSEKTCDFRWQVSLVNISKPASDPGRLRDSWNPLDMPRLRASVWPWLPGID